MTSEHPGAPAPAGPDRPQGWARGNIVIVVLAAGAASLCAIATRFGMGVAPDSAIYLGTAHNLLHGRGSTSPITLTFADYFPPEVAAAYHGALPVTTLPPLYSWVISAIGLFGMHVDTAARVLGVACMGVSAWLVGWITLRLTDRSWPVAGAVVALFVVGGPITESRIIPGSWVLLSGFVLSEALFLVLCLATLIVLARLLDTATRASLLLTGAGLGLAILCRYPGIGLLVTAGLLVLARRGWPMRSRLLRIVALGVLATLPVLAWTVLLHAFVGRGKPIAWRYHALTRADLASGFTNLAHWFVPPSVATGIARTIVVVLFAAVVITGVALWRSGSRGRGGVVEREPADRGADWLLLALVVFFAVYLLALLLSRLFIATTVDFDVRFIAIVHPIAYIVSASVGYRFLRRFGTTLATTCVVVVCVVIVAPFVRPFAHFVRVGPKLPPPSQTARAVKHLPRGALLISNGPDTVWGGTGRWSILVPIIRVPDSGAANRRYSADVRQVGALLRRPHSYLVMFRTIFPGALASTDDLEKVIPLRELTRYDDGAIYVRADR